MYNCFIQVTYHCEKKNHECSRVGSKSLCFCGCKYADHDIKASKKRITSKCKNCPCKEFKFIPQRPEECGMYWLPRRKGFKVSEWKAKCKCKLPHDEHNPLPPYRSKNCQGFYCDFACIACDCRWEDHITLFEFEDERRARGQKVGEAYLPLHHNQELHDLVFHTDRKTLPQYNRPAPKPGALKGPKAKPMIGAGPGKGFGSGGPMPTPSLGYEGYGDYDQEEPDGGLDDRYLDPNMHPNYLQEKAHFEYQVGRRPVGVQDTPPNPRAYPVTTIGGRIGGKPTIKKDPEVEVFAPKPKAISNTGSRPAPGGAKPAPKPGVSRGFCRR